MSLKDALMKAGFRSTKTENHRDSAKGRERKQAEKHQHSRNFCEDCSTTQPDVERYKHHNPTTDAEWICLRCVDRLMIADKFRVTNQSDMAKKGMFKREFGETKDFSTEGAFGNKGGQKRPNGNRKDGLRYNNKGKRNNRAGGNY